MQTFPKQLAVFIILSFAATTSSFIQDTPISSSVWIDMINDPDAKYEEILASFEAWENENPNVNSNTYKLFENWRHRMKFRQSADGRQNGQQNTYEIFSKYLKSQNTSISTEGDWEQIGPINLPNNGSGFPVGLGRVSALAFHPSSDNTIYVGSPSGGIRRSLDYGSTYEDITNNLPSQGISSIVVHPENHDTIYVGTGDRDGNDSPGKGVWRSVNNGMSWQSLNTGIESHTVADLIIDHSNNNILFAATDKGLYRSIDGGQNWIKTLSGNIKDIEIHPTDHNVIYAARKKFYRSVDNGQSWILEYEDPLCSRISIGVSAQAPDLVYVYASSSSSFLGLFKSENKGESLSLQSNSPNISGDSPTGTDGNSYPSFCHSIVVDPNDSEHILTGSINIWESFDEGQNWNIATHWSQYGAGTTPIIHKNHHVLAFSPLTADLFTGQGGGVCYSGDYFYSHTDISNGLDITQVEGIDVSATNQDIILTGTHNGTTLYAQNEWSNEISDIGFQSIIDPMDQEIMYIATIYDDIRRSTNGGSSFVSITNSIPGLGQYKVPFVIHPTNTDTMLLGFNQLYRSFNCKSGSYNNVQWDNISPVGYYDVDALAISSSNPNTVYVSFLNGVTYKTENAFAPTPNWSIISTPISYIKEIEVSPTNSNVVWIASSSQLYQSLDGGMTWTDISTSLPSISINTICAHPNGENNAIYVGMDIGVYYIDDLLSEFVLFSENLPNVEIRDLKIYSGSECETDYKITAATFGRGVWRSSLYSQAETSPKACFTPSTVNICANIPLTIIDKSSNAPSQWQWSFSPETITFLNGTNANSQHPEIQFNQPGEYTIQLTVNNAYGSDTITKNNIISVNQIISVPNSVNFDALVACSSTSDCSFTTCDLGGQWSNLSNGAKDDIDWRVYTGSTPSNNTGPNGDVTGPNGMGNYIYLEASSCSHNTAILESPCLDLSDVSQGKLAFNYHMYGSNMGSLHVDILSNGSWITNYVSPIEGDQGETYHVMEVDLSSFYGEVIRIRLRGVTGSGYASDIALDDIKVYNDATCMVSNPVDGSTNSLRYCIENIPVGGQVYFDSIIFNEELLIDSPLQLNYNLSIMSDINNNILVNAQSSSSAFNIPNGVIGKIKGLRIKKGDSGQGSILENNGILILDDVEIINQPNQTNYSSIYNLGELIIRGGTKIKYD